MKINKHGVVNAKNIRELRGEDNNHLEIPINQLATGLAEVLESIGIKSLLKEVSHE